MPPEPPDHVDLLCKESDLLRHRIRPVMQTFSPVPHDHGDLRSQRI